MSTPYKAGGYYFFTKNNGLQNQSVYFIQKDLDSEAEMFLDPNTLSEDGTVALTQFSVSNNGKYLGYGVSRGGSDWNEFFVKDISARQDLADHIQWVKFSSMAWSGNSFYYSRYPQPEEGNKLKGANSNSRIYLHKVGTSQDADQLIYEDPANPNWSFYPDVTNDEKILVISVSESTSGNALYVKNLTVKNAELVKIVDDFKSDYGVVEHVDGKLLVVTNHDAPRYRLIEIDLKNPARENWKDVIPEDDSAVLKNVSFVGGKLIANYQKDAHSVVKLYSAEGVMESDLNLPGLGTVGGFYGKSTDDLTFYSYSSFTQPSSIYKFNVKENRSELFHQTEIDFDTNGYETKQVFFESKDGTQIPMFIVHKKGLELNGNNPAWIYGYGGFNSSLTPAFDIRRLVWLENGGVYAMVNLRGGGEYGQAWHEAGTKMNKQNVFDDFIAATRYLIAEDYTNSGKIVAQGGSNGGLLIGAVVNQAPELYKVAFPQVGVLDMLRYHKFTIGRFWATDYGTSEDSPEMFEYLKNYSPLHNIREGVEYPAIMVTTGDHDDRVVPAHSFKYAATLQKIYKGKNPVVIRIETQAGHGAGKPTSKVIDEWADIYSFAFKNIGYTPTY
jgi:prolyl oligopeptidase